MDEMDDLVEEFEDELDSYEGVFKNYKYKIVRHINPNVLRGYINIQKHHKLYEIHYDVIREYLKVHGGLTYSSPTSFHSEKWIGFNCANLRDYIPGYSDEFKDETVAYRKFEYVAWACKDLINQIIDLEIEE